MRQFCFFILVFCFAKPWLASAQTAPFQLIFGDSTGQEVGIGSVQLPDGSIYMVGNVSNDTTIGQDVLLLKVSTQGEVLWSRSYDFGESEFGQDFILKNGQFIIAGERNLVGDFGKDAFTLSLDLDGNVLNFNLIGEPNSGEQFQGIAPTATGFIATGLVSSTSSPGNDLFVQHFGSGIADSWAKVHPLPNNDIGIAAVQLPDGNFAVCGDHFVNGLVYNPFVLILDGRGDILHYAPISSPYNGGSKNILVTADGNLLVIGEMATPTSSAFDIFLTKVSPQGQVLWSNYVPSTDASDAGFGVFEVNPGSLLLTGYSFNEAAANSDIVAISTDSLGVEVDRKYFGGPGLDIAYDVVPTLTGGLLLTGKTALGPQQDAILIHDFLQLATGTAEPLGSAVALTVSPNPARAGQQLVLPDSWQGGQWQLLDSFGKTVAEGAENQAVVVRDVVAGTYFLRVKKAGRMGIAKVVVP